MSDFEYLNFSRKSNCRWFGRQENASLKTTEVNWQISNNSIQIGAFPI